MFFSFALFQNLKYLYSFLNQILVAGFFKFSQKANGLPFGTTNLTIPKFCIRDRIAVLYNRNVLEFVKFIKFISVASK